MRGCLLFHLRLRPCLMSLPELAHGLDLGVAVGVGLAVAPAVGVAVGVAGAGAVAQCL